MISTNLGKLLDVAKDVLQLPNTTILNNMDAIKGDKYVKETAANLLKR